MGYNSPFSEIPRIIPAVRSSWGRYQDVAKEFATTLHYYSPRAYEYVRSVLPLPHPSLIRKWLSIVECNPGFFKESFESLKNEVLLNPDKKDCCLIIDGMAIRKQTLWDSKNDKYAGFVDYGDIPTEKPEKYASVVFVLVGLEVIGNVLWDIFLQTK